MILLYIRNSRIANIVSNHTTFSTFDFTHASTKWVFEKNHHRVRQKLAEDPGGTIVFSANPSALCGATHCTKMKKLLLIGSEFDRQVRELVRCLRNERQTT
jgi:hypothetical protein